MKNWPVLLVAGLAAALAAAAAAAQTYPSRPIRLVVPFPPGTASDFLGRTIGAGLTDLYKMQVVVDNRPGAGGLVGTPIVLQATPDGHTLGLFAPPYLTSPMLQKKEPYRPLQDGLPVVQVAGIPNVIGITLALPAKTANVIATLKGTVNPELVYVVSSHFDSVAAGPGADDDTSGTAALLETARLGSAPLKPERKRCA